MPGTEVLGGDVAARTLSQVRVQLLGAEIVPRAALPVHEQPLAGSAPPYQRLHDPVRRLVHEGTGLPASRLRREAETDLAAAVGVLAQQGGEAVGLGAPVALASDPEEAEVEQTRGAGEHAVRAQAAQGQIALHGPPQAGERAGDPPYVFVLRLLLPPPELLVVEVLPAARRVGSDGLDVSIERCAS